MRGFLPGTRPPSPVVPLSATVVMTPDVPTLRMRLFSLSAMQFPSLRFSLVVLDTENLFALEKRVNPPDEGFSEAAELLFCGLLHSH